MTPASPILERYRAGARTLRARFDAVSPETLYAPVAAHLPTDRSDVLDVGAGSGRDAVWLARRGHRVVAVEPVSELRAGGGGEEEEAAVEWVEDALPELAALRGREGGFDLVLVAGVWQHVPPDARPAALGRLRSLLRPSGRIVMSLRHGADEDGELRYACDPDRTIAAAGATGLAAALRVEAPSAQPGNVAAGVTWTWLVLTHRKGSSER